MHGGYFMHAVLHGVSWLGQVMRFLVRSDGDACNGCLGQLLLCRRCSEPHVCAPMASTCTRRLHGSRNVLPMRGAVMTHGSLTPVLCVCI